MRRRGAPSGESVEAGFRHRFAAGYTLLEVIAAVVILIILAALFIPNMRGALGRAGEARCMANMRNITVGLHGYLQDNKGVWPQGPNLNDEKPWEAFWLNVLKPYSIDEKTWQCPTMDSQLASKGMPREERPKVSYVPTLFSAEPNIATRWATQPWLIERANAHQNGALIAFQDGSIKSFNKVLAEMGVR